MKIKTPLIKICCEILMQDVTKTEFLVVHSGRNRKSESTPLPRSRSPQVKSVNQFCFA